MRYTGTIGVLRCLESRVVVVDDVVVVVVAAALSSSDSDRVALKPAVFAAFGACTTVGHFL
jgi:hypothetical protein